MPVEYGLVSKIPLFRDLSEGAQRLIASTAQVRSLPALQRLLSHHTTPAFLVIVLRGQLQKTEVTEDGRVTGIEFINTASALDWLSVIDGNPITCSVNATKESDLLLLPIKIAKQLLREEPVLADHAQQQLVREVRRNSAQRQILALPNAFQRIFVQIFHLAEQAPPNSGDTNLPKQHEIAAMVNTSRETVSRAIQMLVKNGILVKHGHRFVVQHTDQLKLLAAGAGATAAPSRSEKN